MSRKVYAVLSLLLALLIVLPTVTPLASALTATPSKLGKPKAQPWDRLNIPIDFKKGPKVDPQIYAQIESGASRVQVIVVVDWTARFKLMKVLPPGAKLLPFTREVMQYVPLIGLDLPADRSVIDKLASYSWVKRITLNSVIDPNKALMWRTGPTYNPAKDIDIASLKAELRKMGITHETITQEGLPGWVEGYSFFATLKMVAKTMHVDYLWRHGYTGKGVIIAFLDTGINPRHPDFFFPDGRSKIIYGWSPFTAEDYEDYAYGHGTHVASIAAASGRGSGQTWYYDFDQGKYMRWLLPPGEEIGMAPDAYIMMFKIFSSFGEPATIYHIVAAFVEAVKRGADVISNSWGYLGHSTDLYPLYLILEWATQCGVVVVAAAGNDGPGYGTTIWPSNSQSVISVGASFAKGWLWTTYEDKVVWWSSKGPVTLSQSFNQHGTDILPAPGFLSPHRAKPDVMAPGFLIAAANAWFERPNPRTAYDPTCEDCYGINLDGTMYVTYSGTSMSAPAVAGVVADLLQAFPAATPAAIKAALIKGADVIDTLSGIPHAKYGFEDPAISGAGRVNAEKAYKILASAPSVEKTIPPPFWTDTDEFGLPPEKIAPLKGKRILVDDITSDAASFSNFINDLKNLGADVHYLSDDWVNKSTVTIGVNDVIESAHPYEPLIDRWWVIHYPGARSINVHFTHVGLGYSPSSLTRAALVIYTSNFGVWEVFVGAGEWYDQWTGAISGDTVYIRLVTDNSTGYGFQIDRYEVTMLKPEPLTAKYTDYVTTRGISSDPGTWMDLEHPLTLTNYVDNPDGSLINNGRLVGADEKPWMGSISYSLIRKAFSISSCCPNTQAPCKDLSNTVENWMLIIPPKSEVEYHYVRCPGMIDYIKIRNIWLYAYPSFNLNYTKGWNTGLNATKTFKSNLADMLVAFVGDASKQNLTDSLPSESKLLGIVAYNRTDQVCSKYTAKDLFDMGIASQYINVYTSSHDYLTGVWSYVLQYGASRQTVGGKPHLVPYQPDPSMTGTIIEIFNKDGDYITLSEDQDIIFRVFFNFDGRGGGGLTIEKFKVNGVLELPGSDKPDAKFFARYDLVILPKPTYVDADWIDAAELKKYVDEYCGRLLVIAGSSDMVPRDHEQGVPVKMNALTWPFGIQWVDLVGGGVADLVGKGVTDPVTQSKTYQECASRPFKTFGETLFKGVSTLYFGSPLMSMRLLNSDNKVVLANDPLYPAIVLYGHNDSYGYYSSRALFISDSYVLSDITYGSSDFPDHKTFGRNAVAWLICGPDLVDKIIATTKMGMVVNIRYDKFAYNGHIWKVDVTLASNFTKSLLRIYKAIEFKAVLKITSNSSVTGIRMVKDWYLGASGALTSDPDGKSYFSYISNAGSPVNATYFDNSEEAAYVTFSLGGEAFTTLPSDNLGFELRIYANLTGGGVTPSSLIYVHRKYISVLDKEPRHGPSPIVSATLPEELNGLQANMIARHPGDLKWTNVTMITSNLSISEFSVEITGDVADIADIVTINRTPGGGYTLVNLGDSALVPVQNVSLEAGMALNSYTAPTPIPGLPAVTSPLSDGHYPGLPSTGHAFACLQIVIPKDLKEDHDYTGELVFSDPVTGAEVARMPIKIEARVPKVIALWDDGLYIDNRPAVDDPDNYNGTGVAVFTDHTWWHLPWTNLFELWRATKTLEIDMKPTGIYSLVIAGAADKLEQDYRYKPWLLEQKYYELMDDAIKYISVYMITDNPHVRLNGPLLQRTLLYAGGYKTVTYTIQDALFKILQDNKGTFLATTNYYAIDTVNSILKMIGSRIQFVRMWGYNGPSSDVDYGPYWEITKENPITWGITAITYDSVPGYYDSGIYYGYNGYEAMRRPFIDSSIYTVYKLETPVESPHPYPLNYNNRWKITVPGAGSIKVVFKYLHLAEGDEIRLLDWRLRTVGVIKGPVNYGDPENPAGTDCQACEKGGYTYPVPIPGDTVWVQLISDDANVSYGFYIDEVLKAEAVPNDIPLVWLKNPEWLSDVTEVTCTATCSVTVPVEEEAYNEGAMPSVYGFVYAYDSYLMGVNATLTFEGAKVVAFGNPHWWDNRYMFSPSPRPGWPYHILSFFESLFGYVGGYYDKVKAVYQQVSDLINRVDGYIASAKDRNIPTGDAEAILQQARIKLEGADLYIKSGHFLTVTDQLNAAKTLAYQAWEKARDAVYSAVQSKKSEAESAISEAEGWISKVEAAGIDVGNARSLLSDASSLKSEGDSILSTYDPANETTWELLFRAYDAYAGVPAKAFAAKAAARDAAETVVHSARSDAVAAISDAQSLIDSAKAHNVDVAEAEATLESAKSYLSTGDAKMQSYNKMDQATWDNLLAALENYKNAKTAAEQAKAKAQDLIKAAAQKAISEAESAIKNAEKQPGVNTAKLNEAKAKKSEAQTKFERGDYFGAISTAQDAKKLASEALKTTTTTSAQDMTTILVIVIVIIIIIIIAALLLRRK